MSSSGVIGLPTDDVALWMCSSGSLCLRVKME
jgi:hypothetical protein